MKKKILIADDVAYIRKTVAAIGTAIPGCELYEAWDYASCLDSIKKNQPLLVLLDLKMPGSHGFELLQEIRKMDNIAVIVLSAVNDAKTIQEAKNIGVIDYITKPFIPEQLFTKIKDFFKKLEFTLKMGTLKDHSWHAEPKHKMTFIVMDDSLNLARLIAEVGQDFESFNFILPESPERLPDILLVQSVDCILMDLKFHYLTWFEMLHYLREANIHVPVGILSSDPGNIVNEKIKSYGFVFFLERPIQMKNLMEKMSASLR